MTVVRRMVAILFPALVLFFGCGPKTSDMLVLEVGQSKVKLGEYENFFTRNSGGWEVAQKSTPDDRQHFLDLLTNYKLKLQDAYDRNLLQDSEIISELKEYRASLATTFMIEKEITGPGLRQLYDRRKEEIRAEHILIRVAPDAAPADTLKAYAKAVDLIRQLKAGARFDTVAVKNSDDPSVKFNSGDIYYFTGGQMVPSFEDAAYAMKKGEMSPLPVRSPFGYHIIKILDRQPNRGSLKVRHIMTRFQSSAADSADTASARARIMGILDSLKKGQDFAALAIKLSEDGGSASQGGDLGWFERRRFVQPFDEAALRLKAGETSPVVRTPFGYHIIHCDSTKPLPPFDDPKYHEDLKKEYQQRRYNDDYAAYVAGLKKTFRYSFDDRLFSSFASSLDTAKFIGDSAWADPVPQSLRVQPLFTVDNRTISLDTVIAILEKGPEYKNVPLRAIDLRPRVEKVGEAFLLEEKTVGLEARYPEFSSLMQEYTDGIILYKAEQLEVWNKTIVSDSALKSYYEKNKDKFMLPERVNISTLSFDSDTLAFKVYDSLKRGASFNDLAVRYGESPEAKAADTAHLMQPVDTDEFTKLGASLAVGDFSEPVEVEGGTYAIVRLNAHDSARQKTFEEAGAEVSNQYQDYSSKTLEQQWIDRIKLRYPVKQYKEALPAAFSSPPRGK